MMNKRILIIGTALAIGEVARRIEQINPNIDVGMVVTDGDVTDKEVLAQVQKENPFDAIEQRIYISKDKLPMIAEVFTELPTRKPKPTKVERRGQERYMQTKFKGRR